LALSSRKKDKGYRRREGMTMLRKRHWKDVLIGVSLLLAGMLGIAGTGNAEYPERQITVLNAFDPGSPSDLITRAAGIGAEKALGKPLVFENKGGGGGSVALSILATAKPDGYTLSGAPNVAVVDTALMQKVTYKPLQSFTPIVGLARAEHTALLVKSDAPWKTAVEFLDYAKKNPGKIKYSSSGVGTGMHVVMEYIAGKEGIKWVHVPYKGGPAARMASWEGMWMLVPAPSIGLSRCSRGISGCLRPTDTLAHPISRMCPP
jgi:tripartite-type tricarboxylate transporter receptor subunit TctC